MSLRYYQKEAEEAILNTLKNNDKCLVKMFCGTGKTRIMFNHVLKHNLNKLSVIVFPSLALISQFNNDYIYNDVWSKSVSKFTFMNICSLDEIDGDIKYTTNKYKISKFIKNNVGENVFISVTYQSLHLLLDAVKSSNQIIDTLIFDEAHHIVGSEIQKLVFGKKFIDNVDKMIFFTATPKNDQGVTMYKKRKYTIDFENFLDDNEIMYDDDSEDISYNEESYHSDCGPLAYEYTHIQAVNDGVCNNFDIVISMSMQEEKSIHYNIVNTILDTGNKKVFTFHGRSETQHDYITDVLSFSSKSNHAKLTDMYKNLCKKKKKVANKEIVLQGITGLTKNKTHILDEFDADKKNIRILASCNTIGEGVDSKNANMVVFVDPKSSPVAIIQNIGRVCRKQERKSVVLIPCTVDYNKYKSIESKEEKDLLLRQQFNKNGDYNYILNVLSALRQDDQELYDMCMYYPNTFSPKEIKDNLYKQGYRISKEGSSENPSKVIGCDIESSDLDEIADEIEKPIEIRTADMEEPIKVYGKEYDEEHVRLFFNDNKYYKIEKRVKKASGKIKNPKRQKVKINVHVDDEMSVFWDVVDINESFTTAYVESFIVRDDNKWFENLEKAGKFIDENGRLPRQDAPRRSNMSDDLKKELPFGRWLQMQKHNYKNKIFSLRENQKDKRNAWEEFAKKYKNYLVKEDIWFENLESVKDFIDKKERLPRSNKPKNGHISDNLKGELYLGVWLYTQKHNYKNKIFSLRENQKDKRNAWEEFAKKYKNYLVKEDIWFENLESVKDFIDKKERLPRYKHKNGHISDNLKREFYLCQWLYDQKKNYKNNIKAMKENEKREAWEEFSKKYKNYLVKKDIWFENLESAKDFIDKNKRLPRSNTSCISDETKKEIVLGRWLRTQKKNYVAKKESMKEIEKRKVWEEFAIKYKHYLVKKDTWFENLESVKDFIDKNERLPRSNKSKKGHISDNLKREFYLCQWIYDQRKNYKNNIKAMKEDDKRKAWEEFVEEYFTDKIPTNKSLKKDRIKLVNKKSMTNGDKRPLSKISELHKKYKTMSSKNLNRLFKDDPNLWIDYHKLAEENEKTLPDVPYKQIIKMLEGLKIKGKTHIVDMGCGLAHVSNHFKDEKRMVFHNFDHYACNDNVEECDISDVPLEDESVRVVILCMAMWGSNCDDYVQEAYRILSDGGILFMIEPMKRWISEDGKNRLERLLNVNEFEIKSNNYVKGEEEQDKFMKLKCYKYI